MLLDCSSDNAANAAQFGSEFTRNWGCQGGFIDETYRFIQEYGVMREEEYPYQGVQTDCQYDASKIETEITDWGQVSSDPQEIAAKLQEQPLEVGFAITNDFGFFDG